MSKNITYIIADDDELQRELVQQYLTFVPNLQCLGACPDAKQVLNLLQIESPDLLLLDIEMPGMSGLELAKSLQILPLIIFITSHSHFAKEAFDLDAVDFLTKPITPERLKKAIDKALKLIEMKQSIKLTEGFKIEANDSFFIKEKSAFLKINYDEVLYIESLADFVIIFLKSGKKHIALANMKSVEHQLPGAIFIRISRSHMVNKQKVTSIETSSVFIENIQLTIGKLYSEHVVNEIVGSLAIKRFL
jgi:two-component system, LytTR family, response regulator